MLYYKDFEYLNQKSINKPINYVQNFETSSAAAKKCFRKHRNSSARSAKKVFKPYFKEYFEYSSIHCFHNFTNKKLKKYEKFIWLLIILATSICCLIVYLDLSELYHTQRVQTTVADSVYPIFYLPFPAVGLCPSYRINWLKLQNNAPKMFLPDNADNRTIETFLRFFESLADIKFYNLYRLASLFRGPRMNANLSLIDSINIGDVMKYLAFSCDELFNAECFWRHKAYNCCELFTLQPTEVGYCYVFNSVISPEDKEKAFMLKQPGQWHSTVKYIEHKTYTKIMISAQLTETDERCRNIEPEIRRCIFDDEKSHHLYKKIPGLPYWHGNCRTRCHQEYVYKYCNCNLDLLFPIIPSDNFTSCKPSDFKCIYENAKMFSKEHQVFESQYIEDVSDDNNDSMTCTCLNNCNQLLFDSTVQSLPYEGLNDTDLIKTIHFDIHFKTTYLLKYRTAMRYTFVELLANFGGIMGLFLGASLLSAVELVYYFTIGLYARLHKDFDWKSRSFKKPSRFKKNIKIATIS